MKTFTNCAEKKAKQFLNLLQGYTKGIRMTAILILLLMGVNSTWSAELKNGQYIYIKYGTGNWGAVDAKFRFNWFWNVGNWCCYSNEEGRISNDNGSYYAYAKTQNEYTRAVQILRFNSDFSSQWNYTNTVAVSSNTKNCITLTSSVSDNYTFSWSTYAPPMSTVTLANNGTTILGGSGTSSKPYLIEPGTTIKVKASGTKTVPDPDATIYYDFKQSSISKQQGTGTTYSFTASSTANTSYTINLDGFTKISSTSSTKKAATALYFKTIATYAVTISTDGNGTVSPSGDQQVGEAPVSITATANTGYKFKNWTTTGGVVIANANNKTTTITATAAGTVKANFEEDLSSKWKLIGDNQTNSPFGDNYTYSNGKAMTKKSGHSTESNVYITLDIKHLPASYYGFKVATSNSDNDKYGYGTGEGYYITFNRSASNTQNEVYSGSQHELKFIPDALGEYEFRVNYPSNKYVYVTFPTAYAVTFGKGTGGSSVTAKYNSTSFNSGTNVQSGKTVTFTQDASAGYTFKEWNTNSDGTGTTLSTNATYTHTVAETNTVYAIYTPNRYTVRYNANGGTGSMADQDFIYGTSQNLTANAFTNIGYSFNGWNTKADGSGNKYADQASVNNLTTTNNAIVNLYAQWKEIKHDITIQSNDNTFGTVSPSSTSVGQHTEVSITATPKIGYAFKNWTATDGITITDANAASTTIKATQAGTVTANFEAKPATTVYLKPNSNWESANARFAIYYWGANSQNGWVDMNEVDYDRDYFKGEIPYGSTGFNFVRMNPSKPENNWANSWTQTEDLTLPDNCNLFDIAKDASTNKEDKAKGTWMEYNAWHLTGAFNEWALCGQTFKEQGDGSFTFTQHLEADNTYEFKLVHNGEWYGNNGTMVRGTSTGWTMSTSEDNCKITADYTGDYTFTFDASTKKLTVRYPILITLGSSMFGPYGISYNGQSYFSKDDADVVISLPYGATINFIEGQPYSDIYTGGIMEKDKVRQFDLTQPYTIERDIRFDANYVTKVPQVAYLGVPNNNCDWDKNASYANFIWRFDSYSSFPMTNSNDKAEFAFEEDGVKYYKFTIPAGCNKFQIQRKEARVDDSNNTNTRWSHTCDHEYMVLNAGVNCYMLNEGTFNSNTHTGYWCALPPREGDYRLLYVEQVVEKDAENTIITRKKAHPSDIIRKGTDSQIVSLHTYKDRKYTANAGGGLTYESSNNPEIILQKYLGNNQWQDVDWKMVYGPIETIPVMDQLPGRKNASSNPAIEDLKIHTGIKNIKEDDHPDKGNGVWNFVVTQDGAGKASVKWDQTHRYEGKYYIRTNAAFGAWNSYKGSDNHMTRSDVSKRNSNYSHYYCKWVDQVGTNVTYTIANDYGMAISETLTADSTTLWGDLLADADKMVTGETLPASANVRFSWNEKSNFLHRAYLAGSTDVASRFLVLEGKTNQLYNAEGNALAAGVDNGTDPRYGLNANEEIFNDISNWVYYTDVQMKPGAELKLTAKYNGKVQYFIGQADQYNNTVLVGTGSQKYLIRLLYDFKTNELISAYVPGDNTNIEAIQTNLMLLRKENETPRQLSFNANNMKDVGKRAYGVLELTKATLIDNPQGKNIYERSLYWISFPFDVRITDIFGFGEYGKDWIIQSYDGEKRAREGLWADSETNWVYHFDPNTLNAGTPDQGIMKRGVGYVVALNLKNIQADNPFVGRINTLALYFPSTNTITEHIVNRTSVTIDVPEHVCTINRNTPKGDRRVKDSHWNVIGVPSYINAVGNFGSIDGKFDHIELEKRPQQLQFYYQWLGDYDKYEVTTPSATVNFNSLTAYMVQYAGDLTWTSVLNEGPASLAAKRNSDEMEQYHLRLELQQNGNEQDRTFIQLQEDEVTTAFDFNYDLCKIINKGANIYSLIATDRDPIEVAGNVLPVEETIIRVGIKLDAAGEYTFAMPEGTDGIVVELIDYETNTRTNMLLDSYTVNLEKGTFDNRFALHVKPNKTTTSLEDINTNSNGVKKYLIDGILYMQKDGVLYDAQGKLVR